ncbi:hypothetical protein H4R26_000680 [Coemansia thaxteri]|uniref:BZIP domain-containing protein n=1 Tax=Coemansia thaxteri TaxID=2663907 RepID=A0A9W8EHM6_9FUNG|nr:hypothetical protein H4R26_000680 [Coemansia thaxteri]
MVNSASSSDMDGLDFDDEDEDEDDEDANDEYDDAIEDGIANKKGVVSWHTDYRDGGVVIRDEFRSSNEDGGLMDMPGNRRSARLGKDRGNVSAAVLTAPAASTKLADSAIIGGSARASSPRSARRLRNRLAAARMRTRQKQHLVELEKRKEELERRAAELEGELRLVQRKNNPLNASIDKLAEMIDDLTKVESTMLHGIDECKGLLQSLEVLYESRKQQQRD